MGGVGEGKLQVAKQINVSGKVKGNFTCRIIRYISIYWYLS